MIFKKRKRLNNKGFSLMEVLVALAVSATVITIVGAFITQGSKFYSKTGNSVNLQNELQELSNVVCDSLQEATYLEIQNGTSKMDVYTGSYSVVNDIKIFDPGKGVDISRSRLIHWDEKNAYVFDNASLSMISDKDKKGYCYSNYVSNIKISVSEKCKSKNADGYTQPLMLDVTITVSNKGTERSETKNITLRNKISRLRIGDDEYEIASANQLVKVVKEEANEQEGS